MRPGRVGGIRQHRRGERSELALQLVRRWYSGREIAIDQDQAAPQHLLVAPARLGRQSSFRQSLQDGLDARPQRGELVAPSFVAIEPIDRRAQCRPQAPRHMIDRLQQMVDRRNGADPPDRAMLPDQDRARPDDDDRVRRREIAAFRLLIDRDRSVVELAKRVG